MIQTGTIPSTDLGNQLSSELKLKKDINNEWQPITSTKAILQVRTQGDVKQKTRLQFVHLYPAYNNTYIQIQNYSHKTFCKHIESNGALVLEISVPQQKIQIVNLYMISDKEVFLAYQKLGVLRKLQTLPKETERIILISWNIQTNLIHIDSIQQTLMNQRIFVFPQTKTICFAKSIFVFPQTKTISKSTSLENFTNTNMNKQTILQYYQYPIQKQDKPMMVSELMSRCGFIKFQIDDSSRIAFMSYQFKQLEQMTNY